MKTRIIPAINAQTFQEIKEKVNLLKDLTNHFHLDVASLEFTNYQTWQNPEDLTKIENSTFDLHLMLSLKPQEILKWAKENVKTLILHLEASQNPDVLLKMAKKTKKKIFIAWSTDVEFDFIKKYLNYVDGVLILGVRPGRAGQKFLEETYKRIKMITRTNADYTRTDADKNNLPGFSPDTIPGYKPDISGNHPGNSSGRHPGKNIKTLRESASSLRKSASLKLMIDGGVNEENFQKILSYEPDFIVMASAIYNSENPKEKYLWFLSQIKN
jgi:ribulose-phosphate 3-epimerase